MIVVEQPEITVGLFLDKVDNGMIELYRVGVKG
jgi:hypothetical protein